jgi:hypothetical protein
VNLWLIRKNKANLFRIEYCVMRIAKTNLKKQTQFGEDQYDVNAFLERTYGNEGCRRPKKNKANSKPICVSYRGERRARRAKGYVRDLSPNKEIEALYSFSALFADSAVNEKQSQFDESPKS